LRDRPRSCCRAVATLAMFVFDFEAAERHPFVALPVMPGALKPTVRSEYVRSRLKPSRRWPPVTEANFKAAAVWHGLVFDQSDGHGSTRRMKSTVPRVRGQCKQDRAGPPDSSAKRPDWITEMSRRWFLIPSPPRARAGRLSSPGLGLEPGL
jgi:hypothetical protein